MKMLKPVYLRQYVKAWQDDKDLRGALGRLLANVALYVVLTVLAGYTSYLVYQLITWGAHSWTVGSIMLIAPVGTAVCAVMLLRICKDIFDLLSYALERVSLEKPIRADHGYALVEVLWRLRHEPVEYWAVFNGDGSKIEESTLLNPHTVSLSDERWSWLKTTYDAYRAEVHNHPRSTEAFSSSDVGSMICGHVHKSIVIAGRVVYTMVVPESAWSLSSDALVREYNDIFYGEHPESAKILGCEAKKCDTTTKSIRICEYLAEKYDFQFTAEDYVMSHYLRHYRVFIRRGIWQRALDYLATR